MHKIHLVEDTIVSDIKNVTYFMNNLGICFELLKPIQVLTSPKVTLHSSYHVTGLPRDKKTHG